MFQVKQHNITDLASIKFDFLIVASGFEQRATFQAKIYSAQATTKISLGFENEREDSTRKINDREFNKLGFEELIIEGDETQHPIFEKLIEDVQSHLYKNDGVTVYIDYSCMSRNWYSYLILGLFNINHSGKLRIFLGYTHANFVPYNGKETLNRIVSPLFGYCDLNVPSKPTALIIGMGNEPNRIEGLTEYFDAVPYLFYSDKSYNYEYSNEIESLNKSIIKGTNLDYIFKFPIYDLGYLNFMLSSLCEALLRDFRVVIAPCGPKPFALIAMINALNYNNRSDKEYLGNSIEVWRISPGDKLGKVDRVPTGLISVIELTSY